MNYNEPGQFSSSLLSGQSDEPSHLRAKLMQLKSEHMNSVLSHPDSATEELYNRQHSPTQIFFDLKSSLSNSSVICVYSGMRYCSGLGRQK